MTSVERFLAAQLVSLRESLTYLAQESREPQVLPHQVEILKSFASRVADVAQPTALEGDAGHLSAVAQALASLDLLTQAAAFAEGNSLAGELYAALAEIKIASDVALRRRARERVRGLYVIIDPEVTAGRDPLEVAAAALRGGTGMLQLRDKARDKGLILPLAHALAGMCRDHDALFIVNDHADVATSDSADGLHVGQTDLPVSSARAALRPHQIVGRSNYLPEEAVESEQSGADYVAIGNVYPTTTKASIRTRAPVGTDTVSAVKKAVSVPVVAIGGINLDNVGPVVQAGADAVCVSSAVGLAHDPEAAARLLIERIHVSGGKA